MTDSSTDSAEDPFFQCLEFMMPAALNSSGENRDPIVRPGCAVGAAIGLGFVPLGDEVRLLFRFRARGGGDPLDQIQTLLDDVVHVVFSTPTENGSPRFLRDFPDGQK